MTSKLTIQPSVNAPAAPAKVRRHRGLSTTQLALRLYGRLSPVKAGRLVHRMAFRPSRLPAPGRYEHLFDTADSYTQLQHGTRTIPVYAWGQGPTILGVHGWSGAGIQFGAWVAPLVAAGYRVVLYDAPAHGRAQGESTDLFEMADVLRSVAASVGGVYGVMAHSMGALAAARAIQDGLEAEYLALLAPPSGLHGVMHSLGRQLALSPEVLAVHLQLMEERFGASVWQQFDLRALARSMTQRGLIVIDSDDASIAPEDSEGVAAQWQNAGLLRTSGLGHNRILWSPLVIDRVLTDLGQPPERHSPYDESSSRKVSPSV